ncbi:TPA: hypothetical protein ACGZ9C_001727 [Elizabethkingia anophelis]
MKNSTNQNTTIQHLPSAKLMQCLVENNSIELASIERKLTIKEVFQTGSSIAQLIKADENTLTKTVYAILYRFNNLINVNKKLNDDQIIALSADLIEAFKYGDTLEDIVLLFKMARNGSFGDFYRLDHVVIMSWVPKYMDEKAEIREQIIVSEQKSAHRQVEETPISDKTAKMFEKLSKKIKVPSKAKADRNDPLFSLEAYVSSLPNTAKQMTDKELETMISNTSQRTHPEVYNILITEKQSRNEKKK